MIKDIKKLKDHSNSFIEGFLKGCTIREKIDAYYVSVEIRTKRLIFRKPSGKEVSREDLILNSMYGRLMKDFELFRLSNESWFAGRRGYKIYAFFIPCRRPILTEYVSGTNYIVDRIEAPDGRIVSDDEINEFISLNQSDKFGIKRLTELKKADNVDYADLIERIRQEDMTWIDDFIDFQSSDLFAAGVPEGYIFRFSRKYIMQHICENPDVTADNDARIGKTEKAQFEFLLTDFILFWEGTLDDNIHAVLASGDYVKSVCLLFNKYINECEVFTHKIENNVEESSLEPPCVGTRFDIGYDYIPDATTKALCQSKPLYKNIFKILLANLKRKKKLEHCILLNKDKVEKWNEIVTTLKNIC